jgi:hypothetical protein
MIAKRTLLALMMVLLVGSRLHDIQTNHIRAGLSLPSALTLRFATSANLVQAGLESEKVVRTPLPKDDI